MLVLKFGGTSVGDAQPIARAAAIVARAKEPCVVVVVVVRGLFGGETVYAGSGAGGDPTAVAIVSDLLAIARGATSRLPIAFEVPRQVDDVVVTPHYVRLPDGGVQRSWRLLLDSFARHELDAAILEQPGRDRRDPAVLVEMCSSALVDAALATYARSGGVPAISMPVLFRDDEPPAAIGWAIG